MPSVGVVITAMLLLARLGGLMVLMPVFGSRRIPARFRIFLTFSMMLALYPVAARHSVGAPHDTLLLVAAMLVEFLVGLVFGFIADRTIAAVEYAGQLIGLQTGIGMMSLMDPATGSQAQLFAVFEGMFASVVFVVLDLHHDFIRAFCDSLARLPLGSARFANAPLLEIANSTAEVFVLGVRMAAPMMVALFITSLALAIMARAFPQMNAFMLSFPINISLGFFLLSAVAALSCAAISSGFSGSLNLSLAIINKFAGN